MAPCCAFVASLATNNCAFTPTKYAIVGFKARVAAWTTRRVLISQSSSSIPPEVTAFTDGRRVLPVPLFLSGSEEGNISAAYSVLNAESELQYIGKTKDLESALRDHRSRVLPPSGEEDIDPVAFVRIFVAETELDKDQTVERWLDEAEDFPPGNAEGSTYAEMWSQARITSPFEDGKLAATTSTLENGAFPLELDEDNIDLVLDQVRPLLIADGGNISVVSVDEATREVKLLLEGACGSCPSSTTTMKFGVEKVLRERFPDIGDIVAVSEDDLEVTEEGIQRVLDEVQGTISGLGGTVQIVSFERDPVARLVMKYTGPPKLAQGLELLLRDRLPKVREINFEE